MAQNNRTMLRNAYWCEAIGKLQAIQYMYLSDEEKIKYNKFVELLEDFKDKVEDADILD